MPARKELESQGGVAGVPADTLVGVRRLSTVDRSELPGFAAGDVPTALSRGDAPGHAKPCFPGCGASNTATESQVREKGSCFVDWLSVYQVHQEAPVLGDSLLLFVDLETGEIDHQAVRGLQHRGSFDSSLQVRCDGRRVEVSGNPSRWGRRDNVFGLTDIGQCLQVYNEVLAVLGLPGFEEEERTRVSPFQFQRSDSVLSAGPVITRVDLCRNWTAGSADAGRGIVAALSSVVRGGRCGWVSPDGATCAWGVGSRYAYLKYYLKGVELQKHRGSTKDEYLDELTRWATSTGIVRQELSAKAMLLKRHGLDRPGAWSYQHMCELLDEYSPHREAGKGRCSFDELYETLQGAGIPRSRARAAQTALYAFLAGHRFVVGENISKSAFYRLRADIKVAGVDIAAPLNVSALPIRVRELQLSPTAAPDWYRWAG